MKKHIYDENNGLWYELQGDYYILCLALPAEKENKPIGLWGQWHKRYLQEHKRVFYTTLLTSGRLNDYLADIEEQAQDMMFRLVEQMALRDGITEQLKAENPMLWVGRMNDVQARAGEIVQTELIFI
ncbi:TnpV protein [Mediterraneibacter gnavus]|mgnify:CR=1 FL=1|uniref:TnpV protein n=1 Tax=Mediterraneibacter gnavus TaxID=33038 RepID=UPI0018A02467|nr:TnpV protein [Mediterraneibacter gnavus]